MSNLRIIGLIIGILGMLSTFLYYRGRRWQRANFILFTLTWLAVASFSIEPRLVDMLRDIMLFEKHEMGRIMALIVVSSFALWILVLFMKSRLDDISFNYDHLLNTLSIKEAKKFSDLGEHIQPIMVIIPAYNEEENLKELLPQIPTEIMGHKVGVLIVDDGSNDGTSEVAKKHNMLCIANVVNRGQGAASRLGYTFLRQYPQVKVGVTMDADCQHRPEDIPTLIKPILEDRLDLVIGSRVLGKRERGHPLREAGVSIYSWLISRAVGVTLTDCSSGFKALGQKWLSKVRLLEDQFQSTEVIVETVRSQLRIGEEPITIIHRKHGESKKGPNWRYGLNVMFVILKTWLRK